MNWEAIGAVAELLGAAGVIVSLLYLARQMRVANRAAAVHAKLESSKLMTNYLDDLIESPDIAALFLQGVADRDSLERSDYIRFSNMALKAFYYFSAGFFQLRTGALDANEFAEQQAIIDYWLAGDGTRRWWQKTGRHMFGPGFVQYIDARIELATTLANQVAGTGNTRGN
ncbi:MAG: hypothetical protein OEV41_00305 [Gammaproteobacteria bacterium]|nr:hypothetical protein [Gammaproteobacteria bacterium]MDH5344458.1 hypothetical protein [Gammaproteobacteria bacterium]